MRRTKHDFYGGFFYFLLLFACCSRVSALINKVKDLSGACERTRSSRTSGFFFFWEFLIFSLSFKVFKYIFDITHLSKVESNVVRDFDAMHPNLLARTAQLFAWSFYELAGDYNFLHFLIYYYVCFSFFSFFFWQIAVALEIIQSFFFLVLL